MAWVAVAIAAAAAVTAYGNWRASEAAKNASEAERKQLEELFSRIQTPEFTDPSTPPLDLKEYALIKKYVPESMQYIEEANPTIPKYIEEMKTEFPDYVAEVAPELIEGQSAEAKEGLSAQKEALNRLRGLSRTGKDEFSESLMSDAQMRSNLQARAQQDQIKEQFQRRGQFGSGLQFAGQMMGAQANQMSASQAQNQAAQEAYRTKLQALAGSASLGGQMRGEALGLERENTGRMNEYNQRTAARQQDYGYKKADFISDFNARTARNQQDWENQRATIMNQYAQRDADYRRRLEEARVRGANEAEMYNLENEAKINMANTDMRNKEVMYDADMAWKLQQEKNRLEQLAFENEMSVAKGKAGLTDMAREDAWKSAEMQSNTYQGAGEGAATAATYFGGDDKKKTKKDSDAVE